MEADAGVEEGVEEVGDEVDGDEEDTDEEDGAHDDGEVVLVEAIDDDDAHTFPVEDVFDEYSACQQSGQPARGRCDHRIHCVAEGMMKYYATIRKPFGFGGADIVVGKLFEHTVAGELGEGGQGSDAQGERREDEILEIEILASAIVVDSIEVAEHIEVGEIGQHIREKPCN